MQQAFLRVMIELRSTDCLAGMDDKSLSPDQVGALGGAVTSCVIARFLGREFIERYDVFSLRTFFNTSNKTMILVKGNSS